MTVLISVRSTLVKTPYVGRKMEGVSERNSHPPRSFVWANIRVDDRVVVPSESVVNGREGGAFL